MDYLFYTAQGYTVSPKDQPLDSFQILGFERGDDLKTAFSALIQNNPWITQNNFNIDEIRYCIILSNKYYIT